MRWRAPGRQALRGLDVSAYLAAVTAALVAAWRGAGWHCLLRLLRPYVVWRAWLTKELCTTWTRLGVYTFLCCVAMQVTVRDVD